MAILEYLRELGISDIYASPYFQASPTSTHGYDVANHNRISPAIGDASDFRAYTAELRRLGFGQVLDFVPNHMGIGESVNQWWMEVLEDGVASPYARYFDIDWHPSKVLEDRVLLPILGERYGKVLEQGDFQLRYEGGAFSLHYFETRLPINPRSYPLILRVAMTHLEGASMESLRGVIISFGALGGSQPQSEGKLAAKRQLADLVTGDPAVTAAIDAALRAFAGEPGNPASFDLLHELLEAQSYRLSYWRIAAEEINYRRFFDINTLAAIRVEIPEVFEAAHQLVLALLARGDVTGIRIDHVDGLWNPREYLTRLQARYRELRGLPEGQDGLYLVVEKILELTKEQLPADWPVHGTTGYEFANQIVQTLTDSAAKRAMTKIYQRFSGVTDDFAEIVYEKKKLTMQNSLKSEISSLGRMLDELSEAQRQYRDLTRNVLTSAIEEVVAAFPVYRTYVTEEAVLSSEDEKVVLRAIFSARRRNPSIEKPTFDFIRNILLLRLPENLSPEMREAHIRFVMKFQQCSGPVMAKGLEDTTFYLYNRLVALNEVGGTPGDFGMELEEFHRMNAERCTRTPHTMLATSTHDTKRSEDVRMRLVALSEIPDLWKRWIKSWSKLNKKHRTKLEYGAVPSPNEEYALYQALLGTWPLEPMSDEEHANYIERIKQYMLKAVKEAKVNSSWTSPNESWEKAVDAFVESILDPALSGVFLQELAQAADLLAPVGAMNSLTQVILKCTSPGAPDFYQGTEVWDFSLVDPDNRRPVDFEQRKRLLASLEGATPTDLLADWRSGRIKLFLIRALLQFRRQEERFFQEAGYQSLEASGHFDRHVIAFERKAGDRRLVVVVPRLVQRWGYSPTGNLWADTAIRIPGGEGTWRNVLTGSDVSLESGEVHLAGLLGELPFAVLSR